MIWLRAKQRVEAFILDDGPSEFHAPFSDSPRVLLNSRYDREFIAMHRLANTQSKIRENTLRPGTFRQEFSDLLYAKIGHISSDSRQGFDLDLHDVELCCWSCTQRL